MMDNKDNLPELPKGWVWATFQDLLDYIQPIKFIVESTKYDDKYETPVLTAGKSFILGKTNESNNIFYEVPVIIFDDFTTAIKFVNFPFKVKSSAMKILSPVCDLVNIIYVFCYMQTLRINADTHKRYWISHYSKLPAPLPPLPEQHRIVAKIEELFTRLDAGTEALKKVKAELKRYRQAVLKYAFEGKLTAAWREANKGKIEPASVLLERIKEERKKAAKGKLKELLPMDTSALPELPDGWAWASLEHIIAGSMIGLVRSAGEQNKEGIGFPYIKMNNVTMDGKVILDDLVYVQIEKNELDQYEIKENDILFNTRNSIELVGKTGLVRKAVKSMVFNNNLMRIRVTNGISPSFIVYQMCSLEFRNRMEMVKRSTTNVAALYAKDVMPLPVIVPPSVEQNQIVEEIERRLSVADEVEKVIEQSLKQSERLRQSILKKAFAGKLVPQDPTDEPAEKLLERIKAEKARLDVEGKGKKASKKKLSTKQGRLL